MIKMYFHRFQQKFTLNNFILMYIDDQENSVTTSKEFKEKENTVAAIQCFILRDTGEAIITSLGVAKQYRGRGYAFNLLLQMGFYLRNINITKIWLDDMSDHYRSNRNLYLLLGFDYVYDSGPEMGIHIDTLLSKKNLKYYCDRWLN